jgi:hypothetical protein
MQFDISFTNRKRNLYSLFVLIIVGVGSVKLTAVPEISPIVPFLILISTFLFVISSRLIVKSYFTNIATFTFEKNKIQIVVFNAVKSLQHKEYDLTIDDISSYKITSIGGYDNLIDFTFKMKNEKQFYFSFKLNKSANEFLNFFNQKILDVNQNLDVNDKINLIPSFYATDKALAVFKIATILSFILIISHLILNPKTSYGSILITISYLLHYSLSRKNNIIIYKKLKSGIALDV